MVGAGREVPMRFIGLALTTLLILGAITPHDDDDDTCVSAGCSACPPLPDGSGDCECTDCNECWCAGDDDDATGDDDSAGDDDTTGDDDTGPGDDDTGPGDDDTGPGDDDTCDDDATSDDDTTGDDDTVGDDDSTVGDDDSTAGDDDTTDPPYTCEEFCVMEGGYCIDWAGSGYTCEAFCPACMNQGTLDCLENCPASPLTDGCQCVWYCLAPYIPS